MGTLTVRKQLIIYTKFLSVFGGEIILPSLSMFLKYSKSSFALFNLFSLEKYNINWSVREGCEGWFVSLLSLLLLSTKLQTPTDRAKYHKPEGTSREGSRKKEKINRNEGKKDKNTI